MIRQTCGLAFTLGIFCLIGCTPTPTTIPAVSPSALASTQYATIQAAQAAAIAKDWPTYLKCFTPETSRATLRGHLIAVTSTPVVNQDWDDLFARHGITRDQLDTLRKLPAGDAKLKAVLETEQQLDDLLAYQADFLGMLPQLMPGAATPAGPYNGLYGGAPVNLQVIDDRATITLVPSNGRQCDVQLRFTTDGWKIDLPNG